MTTLINGLFGGLLAGSLATVVTRLVAADASTGATLLAGAVGQRGSSSRWGALAAQLGYGSLAGGTIVALELSVLRVLAIPPTAGEAIGIAVAWSALLFGMLTVVLWIGSSRSVRRAHLGELLSYHLIYGLGLGLWIRMTWIT